MIKFLGCFLIRKVMTSPKPRKLILSRSLQFLWPKPNEPIDVREPQPILPEAVEDPDADRKVEPPVESKSKGSSSSVHDDKDDFKRSLGEKALREEAKTLRYMLTHVPKNPYCDIHLPESKDV